MTVGAEEGAVSAAACGLGSGIDADFSRLAGNKSGLAALPNHGFIS